MMQSFGWSGMGFKINGVKINTEKFIAVLKAANLTDCYGESISENFDEAYENCERDIYDTCREFDDIGLGIANIIVSILEKENNGLTLTGCDNYNGEQFVLYQPKYPWDIANNEFERTLTKSKLVDIFVDFISRITDNPVNEEIVQSYFVENCG